MTETTNTVDELDRIDRSIDIDAPAERVWALISQPGWWILSETVDPDQEVVRESDDVVMVHHPEHGDFRVRTVELTEPAYAAFRWLGDDQGAGGTLVEFRIEDRPGGVVLNVSETGFSSLSDDEDTWVKARQGNAEGWPTVLAAARAYLTEPGTER